MKIRPQVIDDCKILSLKRTWTRTKKWNIYSYIQTVIETLGRFSQSNNSLEFQITKSVKWCKCHVSTTLSQNRSLLLLLILRSFARSENDYPPSSDSCINRRPFVTLPPRWIQLNMGPVSRIQRPAREAGDTASKQSNSLQKISYIQIFLPPRLQLDQRKFGDQKKLDNVSRYP